MLVLQANEEQEATFQKLIRTMGEQIVWDGRFLVRDDELILEGTVRSLIFQFDTRKVVTNLIDFPVKEDEIVDVSRHPTLKDLVNMALYAFGKWGTLRGLRVEQDYPQLNQLFSKILGMYYIEPSFRKENFRFYKVGVRITYEEVLQTVLEYEKKQAEDPAAESQGLWHRLIWKNRERVFQKTETTLLERVEDRIGNNFYLVGYACPKCSEKLHMVVYPDGKEVRIDTEEQGVYLARAYTCSHCNCFYTPRPDRLISEGLIYEMDFGDDQKAYEDYLELMGYYGERAANFQYNEYEAVRKQRLQREAKQAAGGPGNDPDLLRSPKDALRQMEDFGRRAASLPDETLRRFAHRIEEGFYPDALVAKHEKKILKEVREREKTEAQKQSHPSEGTKTALRQHAASAPGGHPARDGAPDHSSAGSAASGSIHGRLSGTLNKPGMENRRAGFGSGGNQPGEQYDDMALDDMGQAQYAGLNADYIRQAQHQGMAPNHQGQASDQRMALNNMVQASDPGMELDDMGQAFHTGTALNDMGQVSDQGMALDDQVQASDPGQAQQNGTGYQDHSKKWTAGQQPETTVSGQRTQTRADASPQRNPAQEKLENYQIRTGMLDRLSDRQKKELKKQIQNDTLIDGSQKQQLLKQMEEAEYRDLANALDKKAAKSANMNYTQLQRMIKEAEDENFPDSLKGPYLEKLRQAKNQRANQEVRQIMAKLPERMDRAGYRKLEEKLRAYEGADLSPYKETLRQKQEAAEKHEIASMVKRSRKVSRSDYIGLMRRLEEQEFQDENITPYMEKIKEKVHDLDEKRLDELLDQAQQLDFNTAAAVYEQIDAENFLPELKSSALEMLSKRLEKIRTDECELLVKKLQDEMQDKIRNNARHHFYPARKVMLNTAEQGETSAIDAALAAYANERSMFEYPIFSVDTSRNYNGREGMVLTPENLFYSTRMHAYGIPISNIASVEASTGLLNRKITLEETDGTQHKLPYAVKTGEMEDWAEILGDFVQYLQEKPASRKLNYLARETHDTICCYRCGYVYHGRDVCPECGYKKNR